MRKNIFFVIQLQWLVSSCLVIVQPLIRPDNIVTDKRLEGVWSGTDSKTIRIQKFMNSKFKTVFTDPEMKDWKYTPEDSVFLTRQYVVTFRENKLDYTWLAGVVQVRDQYYLNLKPEECLYENGESAYDLSTETSSIAKLEWKNDNTLAVCFLNGDHIKKIILDGKARVRHEYDPLFGTFIITASSAELEKFLEKYGQDENLYKGISPYLIRRNR